MDNPLLSHVASGNQADYAFGVDGLGWQAFDVVRIHGVDAISELFRYDVVLARAAASGPVDLDQLPGRDATLAIASRGRWRAVHGIVADIVRLERTSTLILYRLRLVPHWWRATLRFRCRTFTDQSLADIVVGVLENRSAAGAAQAGGLAPLAGEPQPPANPSFGDYQSPQALYRVALNDTTRWQDRRLRGYVVQYNESDHAFVSRLLEEEGISYAFEVTAQGAVLTLTDYPGHQPLFQPEARYPIYGHASGMEGQAEVIRTFAERRALSATSVTMRTFAWPRSRTLLEAQAHAPAEVPGDSDHFHYPARDEAVDSDPCVVPATLAMDRFGVERQLAVGSATVRTMAAGCRFTLTDPSDLEPERDHLIVRVETYASQHALPESAIWREPFGFHGSTATPSFDVRFESIPAELRFRPARATAWPRIDGVQTALVTAEEVSSNPEINVDEHARARVRFHWDQNPRDGRPTSMWMRVAQGWAGAAFGALYHPRVGHEVLVAFQQGDPERPVIVGRLYNVQTPPPYDGAARPTVSTLKSQSSPQHEGFNELRFEDRARHEEIYLHAQRDLVEEVRHDHRLHVGHNESISVDVDQTVNVGHDQFETVTRDRTAKVCRDEKLMVVRDQSLEVGVDQGVRVGQDQSSSVGRDQKVNVRRDQSSTVEGKRTDVVIGDDSLVVRRGHKIIDVEAGNISISTQQGRIDHTVALASTRLEGDAVIIASGGGAVVTLRGNTIRLEAADVNIVATHRVNIEAPTIHMNGATETDIHGGLIKLNC